MTVIRTLPEPSTFQQLSSLSVSEAASLRRCPLQVLLGHDVELRRLRPTSPAAMLGTASHATLARLARSTRSESATALSTKEAAQRSFDEAIEALCAERDAQIASRGALPGEDSSPARQLPFYALARAKCVRFARSRFGDGSRWDLQQLSAERRPFTRPATLCVGIHPEVPLHADDSVLRGIADAIELAGSVVAIDEFKSGPMSDENIVGWRLQLVLYGHLYERRFGTPPTVLRLHSLHGDSREFSYDPREGAQVFQSVIAEIGALNTAIENGASSFDLATPSAEVCRHCPHRAWCSPYWESSTPAEVGDVEGTVLRVDGWRAEIEAPSGSLVIDLKWYGAVPRAGERLRLLGTRNDGSGGRAADRTSGVWRHT